ncbi:hypothetical protein BDY21DRAFT_197412 [Lineolata rhizophorae]|uniref:Uncharacterized protein n=1 Tax=Lineolata rhizophorae TaxID=578093 RepID=A0A6A6P4K4_9PEZI|nr:hypothetical protein BDY21DRAFT_197412 [Lineolata rhizophorae]
MIMATQSVVCSCGTSLCVSWTGSSAGPDKAEVVSGLRNSVHAIFGLSPKHQIQGAPNRESLLTTSNNLRTRAACHEISCCRVPAGSPAAQPYGCQRAGKPPGSSLRHHMLCSAKEKRLSTVASTTPSPLRPSATVTAAREEPPRPTFALASARARRCSGGRARPAQARRQAEKPEGVSMRLWIGAGGPWGGDATV